KSESCHAARRARTVTGRLPAKGRTRRRRWQRLLHSDSPSEQGFGMDDPTRTHAESRRHTVESKPGASVIRLCTLAGGSRRKPLMGIALSRHQKTWNGFRLDPRWRESVSIRDADAE